MKVSMIGAGYVGLVSGACFSEFGATVTCLDVRRVENHAAPRGPHADLRARPRRDCPAQCRPGTTPVHDRLRGSRGRRRADLHCRRHSPSRRGDGHADLSFVYDAVRRIAPLLHGYSVIVDKSTVPVGTARQVARLIAEVNPEADFDVASNPEFLREGAAIGDFMRPDRVVIGVESRRAEETLRALYRPLNLVEVPFVVTNLETAELVKYAANAFLATKISFINEMAALCEAVGADVHGGRARVSASTDESDASFCTPARDSAAPAFRRTRWPWFGPPRSMERRVGLSSPSSRSMPLSAGG